MENEESLTQENDRMGVSAAKAKPCGTNGDQCAAGTTVELSEIEIIFSSPWYAVVVQESDDAPPVPVSQVFSNETTPIKATLTKNVSKPLRLRVFETRGQANEFLAPTPKGNGGSGHVGNVGQVK